ncbi:MAG: hypothetical protein HFJ57_06825 [Clostridia bacterium]|nr:hypothetical protein [Clostridia bacterium]
MNSFFDLSSTELVALASILSIYISQGLSTDELATLAGFFTALGDNLAILSSANSCKQ